MGCLRMRLDAGLLVGAEYELIGAQSFALPPLGVKIEDARGLAQEIRVAREDPGAVLPGANGVLVQPAPHRGVADARDDARVLRFARDIGATEARERQTTNRRHLTGEGLDLHDQLWGERPGGGPGAGALRAPGVVHGRSACATGSRHRDPPRARRQSRHWGDPRRRGESSWRGELRNRATYTFAPGLPAHRAHVGRAGW